MTGRDRPPRRPRPPREPKGFTPDAVLSEEEVQRRVELQGGGAPLPPPPPEARFRDRRPTRDRKPERAGARESLLLIGLAVVGIVAVTVLLPDGPLSAGASLPPSEAATAAAVIPSATPATAVTAGPTKPPVLITLPPGTPEPVTAVPATAAPATAVPPTTAPQATPTPRPAATPRPTVKPTVRPTPTFTPTIPPTATLLVRLQVLNGDGGSAVAGDWSVSVTSSAAVSPSTFDGTAAGTPVTLRNGASYSVSVDGPGGYLQSRSADCSSGAGGLVVGGATETCTIQLNDRKPKITVVAIVDGGPATAADTTISVDGTSVTPAASFPGAAGGTTVFVRAGTAYSITASGLPDYASDGGTSGCSETGLELGAIVTCTFTFTYQPPSPAEGAKLLLTMPLLLAIDPRGRRRWTVIAIR